MEVFKKGKVSLYRGDNMEFMAAKPDNYYDLAVVDPEYGIGADNPSKKPSLCKQNNGSMLKVKQAVYKKKEWDSRPADTKYFNESKRVSKNQIIFGVNYYDYDFRGGRIVWNKLNGQNDQFGCEIAYNSINNRTDIINYMWSGMFQGVIASQDIKKAILQQGNKKKNEKRIHPTQKPVKLYDWIFHNYAQKDFKVFDSHGGSFSSAIAAYYYGCEFDGIELDKDYYNDAVKRFKTQTLQTKLF